MRACAVNIIRNVSKSEVSPVAAEVPVGCAVEGVCVADAAVVIMGQSLRSNARSTWVGRARAGVSVAGSRSPAVMNVLRSGGSAS